MSAHLHGVALVSEPFDGGPGMRPVCQSAGCTWRGTLTDDVTAADREADEHAERWEIEYAVTPFPGRPASKLPPAAVDVLRILGGEPQRLSHSEGTTAAALARRGYAVKQGRRGWRLTRRGEAARLLAMSGRIVP